ncbi:MAG: hypothetical protein ACOZNI_09705 [Myxococcota bacterium]
MRSLSIALLVVLSLACAGGPKEIRSASPPKTALRPDGPILYVAADVALGEAPARFSAPLPASPTPPIPWSEATPPRGRVEALACAGDAPTWDAVLAAASEGTVDAWIDLVEFCDDPGLCDVVTTRLPTEARPAAGAVLVGAAIVSCPAPRARALLADPLATPLAVAEFVMAHGPGPEQPWLPRVAAALPKEPEPWRARVLAMAIGAVDGPASAKALLDAHTAATDPMARRGIAAAMYRQSDPLAKTTFDAMCSAEKDPMCGDLHGDGWADDAGEPPPGDPLATIGRSTSFDSETDQWPNEHDALLQRLALLGDASLRGVIFEEIPPAGEGDLVVDAVTEGGKVREMGGPTAGLYVLRAYAGGKRWEAHAADLGDWYDLEVTLGLLNTVAKDLASPTRFVALATGDQTATVLAAPEERIRAAIANGEIRAGDADDARATGKAFEEKVLKQLEAGGIPD